MSFYKRGVIILCGVAVWGVLSRFVHGHPWSDTDWLGATVIGLGVWIAWMLSDVISMLRTILEKLEELEDK
jgi:hypothetical protein